MNILQELEDFINTFNQDNQEDFSIDSIRVEFSKQHKQDGLREIGKWSKIKNNSPLLSKLKKRLTDNEITSVWRLEDQNIYYYNMQDAPKYRKATLVIFGIQQYHQEPPPRELLSNVLSVLKSVSNIDICLDLPYKPNIAGLRRYFQLIQFITSDGNMTDTHYINDTGIPMIDKITIYNKGFKNKLDYVLWRIEAMVSIPNFRALALPLHEFKEITDILRRNSIKLEKQWIKQ